MPGRRRLAKATRKAIGRGERRPFRLDLERRTVVEMPWLEFDGNGTPAVAEAARRAIAAELAVPPALIEVEIDPDADLPADAPGPGRQPGAGAVSSGPRGPVAQWQSK